MSPTYASFLLALPALVAAHGHVELVRADGVTYQGWNSALKFQNPIPETVGWQADNLDNGFVEPNAYGTDAIACHKQSKPNGGYVTVQPGSEVTFLWDTWPESHKGPIIDYIAPCNGDCNSLSAGDLRFTKIQEGALISGSNPGTWVTDELIANNFSSTVTIPNVAPGNYVIRHEIIALHSGSQVNGAQSYPQCINFKVEGSGTTQLTGGVPATSFYTPTDPGIHFTLWQSFDSYPIPGPALAALKKRGHAKDFAL